MANPIQASRVDTASAFTTANATYLAGEICYESDTGKIKIGDGVTAWGSLPYFNGTAPTIDPPSMFGDGSDLDVTLSSGTLTQTRDYYYNNLTLEGTAIIVTNGYKLCVKDTLNLVNAQVGAIRWNGNNGSSSSGTTAGAGGAGLTANSLGTGTAGSNGAAGATGAGAQGAAPTNVTVANGGAGGQGGAGGAGNAGANAGGAARGGASVSTAYSIRRPIENLIRGVLIINSAGGGAGGSAGGGDGTTSARGAAGGGSGAGVVGVWARRIWRDTTSAEGSIQAIGGNAGASLNATGTNVGGAGGAGGGGGGFIYLVYEELLGSAKTNLIDASGGNGSAGGNATGTGVGGAGGQGGAGGRITLFNTSDATGSETFGSAGTSGGAASGTAGGSAGVGNQVKVTL